MNRDVDSCEGCALGWGFPTEAFLGWLLKRLFPRLQRKPAHARAAGRFAAAPRRSLAVTFDDPIRETRIPILSSAVGLASRPGSAAPPGGIMGHTSRASDDFRRGELASSVDRAAPGAFSITPP